MGMKYGSNEITTISSKVRNDRVMGSCKSFLGKFIDYIIANTLIKGSLTVET
jgi:hypothetical protein